MLSLQASYAAPLILLAQNRQADRDRLALEEDRRRAAMQKADTEYLAREIAALRIALGEVATRDFLRSELARLAEELDEAAQRRQRAGAPASSRRPSRQRAARRRRPADDAGLDEPPRRPGRRRRPAERPAEAAAGATATVATAATDGRHRFAHTGPGQRRTRDDRAT